MTCASNTNGRGSGPPPGLPPSRNLTRRPVVIVLPAARLVNRTRHKITTSETKSNYAGVRDFARNRWPLRGSLAGAPG
jgi:hypothetical protein